LGGLGFLETAYLTYLKVSNTEPFCPVGGGSCSDVLNSDYAMILGVPLPLIGMTAYGLIFLLGLKLGGWNVPLKINQSDGRLLLLPVCASMAAASAYFLYTLATRLEGASCSYCLASATLSFSLFFIILKDFGLKELQKVVALPLCTAAIVLGIINTTYNSLPPISPRSEVMEVPYYTTEITSASSPYAISLAKHLKSTGAKMYGAFWCSHCQEQKQMFGREAMELLDYVECFPDGVKKGIKIASVCSDVGIEGFPTWLINGEVSLLCLQLISSVSTWMMEYLETTEDLEKYHGGEYGVSVDAEAVDGAVVIDDDVGDGGAAALEALLNQVVGEESFRTPKKGKSNVLVSVEIEEPVELELDVPLPPPAVGMVFASMLEVDEYFRNYGQQ
uniref:Vitamin K epoxide reductase domain-containing protein n=1 Tax=Chenopodium quinoa TaxID=63459 RepID=A0A803MRA8_CHEQI